MKILQRIAAVSIATGLVASTALAQHGSAQHAAHGHHQAMQHAAAAQGPAASPKPANATDPGGAPEPKRFETSHSIEVGGKLLRYRAIASETFLKGPDGKPTASIFSIAYIKENLIDDPAKRPVTFVFNGGPGSSSVWLHLGAFGPVQLDLGPDPLEAGAPPYPLRANPHTLLTHTDLVFIDPVGTGYSRPLGDATNQDFWGVDEDSKSVAGFIRLYLTRHKRWQSPKYLAGESYGTTRASLLIRDLALPAFNGVAFNGVILLSAALDIRIFMNGSGANQLPFVTHLPTYAATAYYHDRLSPKPRDLEAFLLEVRDFAATDLLTALFQGDDLPDDRSREIAERISGYTGLSTDFVLRNRLRVTPSRFTKELLRDRGETLGLHDTRFRGRDPDAGGEAVLWDPFQMQMSGPFVTAINSYLGEELKVDIEREYKILSFQANFGWKRPPMLSAAFAGYLYTTPFLAQAAAANEDFRVFVASGYHDLTTSFFGVEHTMRHSGIDKKRITLRNYPGGHMMYVNERSLQALSKDIRAFIGRS